jgi:UDP-glucose:(heptosyl)LPS alpha-1,3-glucosyltransferase
MTLERRVYRRTPSLSAVSGLVASQLEQYFQRADAVVIRNGVDASNLSPALRLAARPAARERMRLITVQFTLLLIGNDWKKKGLLTLLEALAACRELPLMLLVVGSDDRAPYDSLIRDHKLTDRVRFLEPAPEVLQFYAVADAYVGPSLEDAYGLPIIEAMACGLPVIASSCAGASEIITDGKDGLIMQNPRDHRELAELLRLLCSSPDLREQLGREARITAQRYTWECNAAQTWSFLDEAAAKKAKKKGPAESVSFVD